MTNNQLVLAYWGIGVVLWPILMVVCYALFNIVDERVEDMWDEFLDSLDILCVDVTVGRIAAWLVFAFVWPAALIMFVILLLGLIWNLMTSLYFRSRIGNFKLFNLCELFGGKRDDA